MVDLEVQTIAAKLAFEFNDQLKRVAPDVHCTLEVEDSNAQAGAH
jgi:hypothetical protein